MKQKHITIGTVIDADKSTRKINIGFIDGDQWADDFFIRVPKKFPMPVPVNDGDFLDTFGRLPNTIEKCHVKIGYDYAYDVKRYYGKFKLRNPVYLGEIKANSCRSINGFKKTPKGIK